VQFFRLPWFPELLIRQGHFRALSQSVSERARPGAVTPEELERYRAAWSASGALTALLNWYRAFLRKDLPTRASCRVASRVLLIWGERDPFGVRDLAEASLQLYDNGRVEFIEDATHWVQHDEPERCREILLRFLHRAEVTLTHYLRPATEKPYIELAVGVCILRFGSPVSTRAWSPFCFGWCSYGNGSPPW
jgi:pimeloyl-ACP methyl ester carboxylesterase